MDLLYLSAHGVIPVEIKSAMTYHPEFLSGIRYFQKLSGSTNPGWVVYAGELEFDGEGYRTIHFANAFAFDRAPKDRQNNSPRFDNSFGAKCISMGLMGGSGSGFGTTRV